MDVLRCLYLAKPMEPARLYRDGDPPQRVSCAMGVASNVAGINIAPQDDDSDEQQTVEHQLKKQLGYTHQAV